MRVQLLAGVSLVVVSVSAAHASGAASADLAVADANVETITILGLRGNPRDVAGSAQLITTEELRLQDYADVSRVLRRAPGVNVHEEDRSIPVPRRPILGRRP
jgi:Fe(3+) dicitrate transport protein